MTHCAEHISSVTKQKIAVTLLSGGLDSYTAAALIKAKGFSLYALTVCYGQVHVHEIEASRRVARALGVENHKEFSVDLSVFGGSALTGNGDVPKDRSLDDSEIPPTYVPARNAVLLSLALAWAESIGSRDIVIGVNALDYSGYPDCRPEFIRRFEELALSATKAGVEGDRFRIHAPLINLSKADIVRRGRALSLEFGLTHSCYDPIKGGRPCGRCDSCRLRAKGFIEAGIPDPLLS